MAELTLLDDFGLNADGTIVGSLVFDEETRTLLFRDEDPCEPDEVLSVRSPELPEPAAGHTIIKSWSEYLGMAQRLEAAGAGRIISFYPVGNYDAMAYLLALNIENAKN